MNNHERKEKAGVFFKALQANENLKKEFIANPTMVLEREGIITAEEAKLSGLDDYYQSLAKKLGEMKPHADQPMALEGGFWCWSCKIGMSAAVAAAVAAATIATGGIAIAALAEALAISEAAAAAAVAAAGGGGTALIGCLLTAICGDC